MLKKFDFEIPSWQIELYFKPIRTKIELLIILFEAIRFIQINPLIKSIGNTSKATLTLEVDKMSRLTFHYKDKIFSITMPFHIEINEDEILFSSHSIGYVDSMIISQVLEILCDQSLINEDSILDFSNKIKKRTNSKSGFWSFFRELLVYESGYVRYDYDNSQLNNDKHPVNHIDVFYSSKATFKVGLSNNILIDDLHDILDLNTNCHFLSKSN